MPGTTSIHSLRYPLISEAPDGPTQIGNLADDVDATLPYYGSSAPSSPVAGTMWVDADDGTCKIYSGSAWVGVTSDSGVVTTGVLTAATGYTLTGYRIQKTNSIVQFEAYLTTTAAISANTLLTTTVATLADDANHLRPAFGSQGLPTGNTGPTGFWYITSAGLLVLRSLTIAASPGATLSVAGSYRGV
jgi:hypothetical protein